MSAQDERDSAGEGPERELHSGPDSEGHTEPESGAERLAAGLRQRPSRGQLAAGVLLAALGFAAVVQVQSNTQDATYVGARQDELIALINSLSLASDRSENEIAQLQETRRSLLDDTESRQTALERSEQLADERGILAGTLAAAGPGVRVTVTDAGGAVGANNLVNGIQELRDAGAEAIEINGQVRVVAQTAIRDLDEGGVQIDGTRVEAPYVIEAIGSPPTLSGGLQIARGFRDEVLRLEGTVRIEEVDSLELTAVVDPVPPEYAEPAPTE